MKIKVILLSLTLSLTLLTLQALVGIPLDLLYRNFNSDTTLGRSRGVQEKFSPDGRKDLWKIVLSEAQPILWAADLSEQAVEYRLKGYQAQKRGDIDSAIKYYQKAVVLMPGYATPYNDLGVVYEGKGWLDKAERAYLKALQIDPNYMDVYSNLALLYEKKNEIKKAVFYWKKRVKFGDPNEFWTQKSWQKLAKYAPEEIEKLEAKRKEEEAKKLAEIIAREKEKKRRDDILLAQEYYRQANALFKKGRYDKALKKASEALKLSPKNEEIINLRKKTEIKINERKIATHYAQGMKYYQNGDYLNAGEEFKKMLKFLPGEN